MDNLTAPASGAVLATDDIGGVHYPKTKLVHGANDTATDVTDLTPLPVKTGGLTDAQLRATALPVSIDGTDATGVAQLAGGAGARGWLSAIYKMLAGTLKVDGSAVTQPVSGPVTDTQLRATALPVSIDGTDATGVAQLAGGAGARGWLSAIYKMLAGLLMVDTVVRSLATNRGAIIGFTGATFTTTAGSTSVTLVGAATSGTPAIGQQIVIAGAGLAAGTTITAIAGSTYTLSLAAANAVTAAAATSVGPQQIMPANAARRGVSYQVQSAAANVWVNGVGAATTDYNSLQLFAKTFYETPANHVGPGAIAAIADTPATPLYSREY